MPAARSAGGQDHGLRRGLRSRGGTYTSFGRPPYASTVSAPSTSFGRCRAHGRLHGFRPRTRPGTQPVGRRQGNSYRGRGYRHSRVDSLSLFREGATSSRCPKRCCGDRRWQTVERLTNGLTTTHTQRIRGCSRTRSCPSKKSAEKTVPARGRGGDSSVVAALYLRGVGQWEIARQIGVTQQHRQGCAPACKRIIPVNVGFRPRSWMTCRCDTLKTAETEVTSWHWIACCVKTDIDGGGQ
jgi:hypothetical protein